MRCILDCNCLYPILVDEHDDLEAIGEESEFIQAYSVLVVIPL